MQKAIKQKQRGMLRLVKSSPHAIKSEQKPMVDSEDYYKQVECYAEQIRKTSSADEIIRILDIVLSEYFYGRSQAPSILHCGQAAQLY